MNSYNRIIELGEAYASAYAMASSEGFTRFQDYVDAQKEMEIARRQFIQAVLKLRKNKK